MRHRAPTHTHTHTHNDVQSLKTQNSRYCDGRLVVHLRSFTASLRFCATFIFVSSTPLHSSRSRSLSLYILLTLSTSNSAFSFFPFSFFSVRITYSHFWAVGRYGIKYANRNRSISSAEQQHRYLSNQKAKETTITITFSIPVVFDLVT